MLKKIFIPGVILALLFVSGCAFFKKARQPQPVKDWEKHFNKMSRLDSWRLAAKVGIQSKAHGSGSIVVDWRQGMDCYRIHISSGFGQTVARLVGHKGRVTLFAPGKEPIKAETLEDLAYLQTGWWIPLSYIQYWALGIPAPFSRFEIQKNKNNLLQELTQAEWSVSYGKYREFDGYNIPVRIQAEGQDMKITLITREWLATPEKKKQVCEEGGKSSSLYES